MATLQYYMSDREVRVRAWRSRIDHEAWTAQPNAGHLAIADLERKGKLHTLVTQNVDGLHHMAGSSPERIVEIHGTMREGKCMSCGERAPMGPARGRGRAGGGAPPCRTCGGILKSATISFGQQLVQEDLERAYLAAEGSDLFLAVGTSLVVYPVADLPRVALSAGPPPGVVQAQEKPEN